MICLEPYSEKYLKKSWLWLKDPELKYLTQTNDFSKEDQLSWYHNLPNIAGYLIWGVSYNQEEIGVFGIKKIENQRGEYWGYIGEKKYWGMGLGKEIMLQIFAKAKEIGIAELYLKVIEDNLRALQLYTKLGFEMQANKEENLLIMVKSL